MPEIVICPYCKKEAKLVDAKAVYGDNAKPEYGMFYLCKCEPGTAYVGCHKGTEKPLGRLANEALRMWKREAHSAFDPVWNVTPADHSRSGRFLRSTGRSQAYHWLARELNIPVEDCHIGMFDIEMCRKVVQVCKPRSAF